MSEGMQNIDSGESSGPSASRIPSRRASSALQIAGTFPLLVLLAIAYACMKAPSLAPYSAIFGPVAFIIAISYASKKGGVRIGLLAALAASFYFVSVPQAFAFTGAQDALGMRIGFAALAVISALVFSRRAEPFLEKPAVVPIPEEPTPAPASITENDTISPYAKEVELKPAAIDLSVLQSMPMGVFAVDSRSREVLFINSEAEKLVGELRTMADLQAIEIFDDAGSRIDAEKLPLFKALRDGMQTGYENYSVHRDGMNAAFRMSASPLIDDIGASIGAVAVLERLPETRATDARQADFMDIARTELAPQISRLDRYVGALKLYANKLSDAHAESLVARLEAQFRNLDHTMQRLLQFARIDFDDMQFKSEIFDISKLLSEAIDIAQRSSGKHQLVFLPQTDSFALGDRFRVRKVFDHLLNNAIRHSPQGGKVIIGLQLRLDVLTVSVRDFGTGLSEADLIRIEDAFSVSEGNARRAGLGIGLYTSNEIVRRLKGEMGVRGRRGKGTEFYFTLPAAVPTSEQSAREAPSGPVS